MSSHQHEELAEIRRAVAGLCEGFPGEYWRAKDGAREYPAEFVDALTKAGFLAALIPAEHGGSGLSLEAACVIMEEIQASGCNGSSAHAQMYIMNTLLRYGSEAQKAHYLPRIASGELRLQAFGVSEPTSGTDTLSLKTRAVRDGDEYIISGQKIWTSRAEYSDLMLLLARTTPREEAASKTEGLSIFLVDMQEAQRSGMVDRVATPESLDAETLKRIGRADVLLDAALYNLAFYGILFALAWSGHAIEAALLWWLPRHIGLTYIQYYLSWAPHHPATDKGRYRDTRSFRSIFGNRLDDHPRTVRL